VARLALVAAVTCLRAAARIESDALRDVFEDTNNLSVD
jgi:hypothetical protein